MSKSSTVDVNMETREMSTPAQAGSSKKRIIFPILAVVLMVALYWGWKTVSYARAHESTENAQVDGHIVPVLAKVSGYVRAVNATDDQHVDSGSTLVELDASEFEVRRAQTEAELAAAQATAGSGSQVGAAEAQVRTAQSQTAAGQAQIEAARAALLRAESDLARYQSLAAQQIISQQNLEAARTAVTVARAQLASTERQAAASGGAIVGAEAGVRLAAARLAAARAARDNAALQLSYTKISAPASGLVARKTVEVGQLVQAGQTLLSIVSDTGVWVTANFKETQLSDIRVGQHVELDVDAYKGHALDGVVESIGSATGARFALLPPDNATGNFTKIVQRVPVRIRLAKSDSAGQKLRPGMSVAVHVDTR